MHFSGRKKGISGAAGAAASTAVITKNPWAVGGMAVIGGAAGYAFGSGGGGAISGAVSAGFSARTARGALVGAFTGGAAGQETIAIVAGVMGAYEGFLNAPKSLNGFEKGAFRVPTGWDRVAVPAIKGIKSGLAGWAASTAAEFAVDGFNEYFGDCECEGK